ncbi:MAG: acyltransferase, partial [Frondihabitans sp.]|nr:acyltransferase [Frondihabitans sp.]
PAMNAWTGCRHDVTLADRAPRTCTWGDAGADQVAVVIGDSVAASWTSSIAAALVPRGWKVVALTYGGCSAADVAARGRDTGPDFVEQCHRSRDRMFDLVRTANPDLAILASGMNLFDALDEAPGGSAESAWRSGTARALQRVSASAATTVVLGNPPVGRPPAECAARTLSPASCLTELDPRQSAKDEAERLATLAAAQAGQKARFIEATHWFCSTSRSCPAFVGDELVRGDRTHITNRMGLQLRGVVGTELVGTELTAK